MAKQKVEKHKVEGKDQETRRTLLKGIAGSVPVILTVAHRPAFGQTCTDSAMGSAIPTNPSGVDRHPECTLQGFSAEEWADPDNNGPVGPDDWHNAGAHPNEGTGCNRRKKKKPRRPKYGSYRQNEESEHEDLEHEPTKFNRVFGRGPSMTLHDALLGSNELERQAAAAMLNARCGRFPGYMSPEDVVELYRSAGTIYSTQDVIELFRRING